MHGAADSVKTELQAARWSHTFGDQVRLGQVSVGHTGIGLMNTREATTHPVSWRFEVAAALGERGLHSDADGSVEAVEAAVGIHCHHGVHCGQRDGGHAGSREVNDLRLMVTGSRCQM